MSARPLPADVRPLFATPNEPGPRAFGAALPARDPGAGTSPWSPGGAAAVALAAERRAIEAARAEAIAAGRAEGLRETAELRAQLTALCAALTAQRERNQRAAVDAIAEASSAALEAWLGALPQRDLLAPIIQAWLARVGDGAATATVRPADAALVRELIGDAGILVEADPALAPGDVRICNPVLELDHRWDDRLRALRETIAIQLADPATPDEERVR